jgi:hypothetical protein
LSLNLVALAEERRIVLLARENNHQKETGGMERRQRRIIDPYQVKLHSRMIAEYFQANDVRLFQHDRGKELCDCLTKRTDRIAASVTDTVPWGFVCGFPTKRGDLYGGAHYSQSCSATLTLQGAAIQDASVRFGDGSTLPFTPCKKGYVPVTRHGHHVLACPLHDKARSARREKEKGVLRNGEVDPTYFWERHVDTNNHVEDDQRETRLKKQKRS